MAKNAEASARRLARVRRSIKAAANGRPRLSVFRSSKQIYAQIIDDVKGATIVAASTTRRPKPPGRLNETQPRTQQPQEQPQARSRPLPAADSSVRRHRREQGHTLKGHMGHTDTRITQTNLTSSPPSRAHKYPDKEIGQSHYQ